VNLHEYQAKQRFARFGIPTPQGIVATTAAEAEEAARQIGGTVVVKAQVLTGGRGKAGGVKLAHTPEEARQHASNILGMDIKGLTVHRVLIDPGAAIEKELYLSITNDRTARRPLLMASAAGGMDIEEVNATTPEQIVREHIDPFLGLRDYQARNAALHMGLPRPLWKQFGEIAHNLYRCYIESDATLVEINPLAILKDGTLMALDGKFSVDDNALFRQAELAALRDVQAEPEAETRAREADLNYVKLDGDVGCMVNGAGLAMTTMDLTTLVAQQLGYSESGPANFLDVGGGARAEKVAAAMRIILSEPRVKAILFNIFGGITRCDEVARGILQALDEVKTEAPMIVRFAGTNATEGRQIIDAANLTNVRSARSLYEAAELAVRAANGA
jgi:succinyl-CoA synthetase beta subunit